MNILGLMTGTSCDGLDGVCISVSGPTQAPSWKILWSDSIPYPLGLRSRVLKLQKPGSTLRLRDYLKLDRDLGEWYGKSVLVFLRRHKTKPDLIANHGQTIAHHPELGATLQCGDPSRLSKLTGLTVISHFREGDLSAGGQGAPLLPLFHEKLARGLPEFRHGLAIHNLGGISNLTYIPPSGRGRLIAFDTGPANIWIDAAMELISHGKKSFDRDGEIASRGSPDLKAIRKILSHPYFKKAAPKSTGRDDFPFSTLLKLTSSRDGDLVATATWITALSIADAYQREILFKKRKPLKAIYFAGGGAKNLTLMKILTELLDPIQVKTLSDGNIPGLSAQNLEPLGFALFGYLSLEGTSLGGSWTGAQGFGPPGWITPGENWKRLHHRK